MHSRQGENSFDVQIERIYMVTGRYSEEDLAEFLGILANEVVTAKDRGYVPAEWLIMLLRAKGINPEWILTGNGPWCIQPPIPPGHYETSDDVRECQADREALRRLSSKALAEELVRRTALMTIQDEGL